MLGLAWALAFWNFRFVFARLDILCIFRSEDQWGEVERFSLRKRVCDNFIPTPEKPHLLPPWAEDVAKRQSKTKEME